MANYGSEFECKRCGFYGLAENVESTEPQQTAWPNSYFILSYDSWLPANYNFHKLYFVYFVSNI